MELNPEIDLEVNLQDLTGEFKKLSLLLYRYSKHRAQVCAKRDLAKAKYKETRATVYKRVKSDLTKKYTENGIEAEIDTDQDVIEAYKAFIKAEHDASTWDGAVDSMKAKKDMIIQIGADNRKDRQ